MRASRSGTHSHARDSKGVNTNLLTVPSVQFSRRAATVCGPTLATRGVLRQAPPRLPGPDGKEPLRPMLIGRVSGRRGAGSLTPGHTAARVGGRKLRPHSDHTEAGGPAVASETTIPGSPLLSPGLLGMQVSRPRSPKTAGSVQPTAAAAALRAHCFPTVPRPLRLCLSPKRALGSPSPRPPGHTPAVPAGRQAPLQ